MEADCFVDDDDEDDVEANCNVDDDDNGEYDEHECDNEQGATPLTTAHMKVTQNRKIRTR